jgi:hypothetical protein
MRKLSLLAFLFVFFSSLAYAVDKPCMVIGKECKDAGFSKDGAPGKDILEDCIKPIAEGKTVNNVTFTDTSIIAACKKKLMERVMNKQ